MTTIYYLVMRERGSREARRVVETLLGVFQVVPVNEQILREALTLAFSDFDDAVCAEVPPQLSTFEVFELPDGQWQLAVVLSRHRTPDVTPS